MTLLRDRRILENPSGGGITPADLARITTLENNEYKVAYFASVNSDSGTIVIPTGATILLNQFPGGVDAYASTISSGQPTGKNPVTAGSAIVDVASFDASGNYTLTGVPSAYPVALIYILKIKAKDFANLTTDNIIEYEQFNYTGTLPIVVNQNTKAISIEQGGPLQNGYISAVDWSTFNAKGDALIGNPLSQFAATTSAQLRGVITDETGTGSLVFGTSPTFITSITTPKIIGGLDVGSQLILQGTSGIGTTTASALAINVGNNGALNALNIYNDGQFIVGNGITRAGGALSVMRVGLGTGIIDFGQPTAGVSAIWLAQTTPNSTNYTLSHSGTTFTVLNAPTTAGTIMLTCSTTG